jgi:glycosyltransferase involved in cell wall biosynthesis
MNKINASVVIPTHRSDISSLRRLISTIDLFLQHGFEVVLADNSGCLKKAEQLRSEFSNAIIFAETAVDCNASDNFFAGFTAASENYVMFVSDDDVFLSTGVQALAHAIEHSTGYQGFSAPVVHHAQESTTVVITPDLTSQNSTDLLIAWATCDPAVSFYGCYSQTIWQRYFRFVRQHPVKLAHHDQFLRFFIADVGNIACLKSAWMAYDRSNWSDGQTIYNSLERFYVKAGLDGRMYYAEPLWEAIEGILCQFKLDELAGRENQYAFIPHWWGSRFEISKQVIATNRHAMPPAVWQLLEPLVNYLDSPSRIDAYQILQLLSQFMVGLYGSDGGLQHFWLHQATASLKPLTIENSPKRL